jgi:hypothetical protein
MCFLVILTPDEARSSGLLSTRSRSDLHRLNAREPRSDPGARGELKLSEVAFTGRRGA